MAGFRVEFSFPLADGSYADFVEVTEDIVEAGFGNIKKLLDSNEHDIGTLKFNNFKLVLRNEHGAYSDAIDAKSIFPEKRDQTLVRVLWNRNEDGSDCGACFCGLTFLDQDVEVFKGLLEDNSTKFDTDKQTIKFSILGIESIIAKAEIPFSSLSAGDTAEEILFTCLNQSRITQFFTVDALNINVNNNFITDAIASLEDSTVLEVLEEVLFLSGSILFVEDDIVYVRSRAVDPTSSFTFYSPSSDLGIENIINISNYSIGLNKTFNFFKWRGTSSKVSFTDSIERYGLRKKEIESDLITDQAKQLSILNTLITEYGFPVIEYDLTTPLYTQIVELKFLNKVNVDYPADYLPTFDSVAARYGQARYGQGRYARQVSSLFISVADDWKILNKTINPKSSTITFRLRGV